MTEEQMHGHVVGMGMAENEIARLTVLNDALVEALRETQQLLQVWNYDFVKERFYKNAEVLKQVSNG